jgi:hypothetical protein
LKDEVGTLSDEPEALCLLIQRSAFLVQPSLAGMLFVASEREGL